MLHFLRSWFRGILSTFLVVLNTMVCGSLVTLLVPVKVIIPLEGWRNFWTGVMLRIGSLFILINKEGELGSTQMRDMHVRILKIVQKTE